MFRYSTWQYNQGLLIMGSIRVGTLHDFRNSEHKSGIADPKEGKKTVNNDIDYLHISKPDSSEASEFEKMADTFGSRIRVKGENLKLINCCFRKDFDSKDYYILCTSEKCSVDTMAEFEGVDSCVEIIDIQSFYKVLTETLNSITPVVFRGVHKVVYQEREEPWNGKDWGKHPAVIKEQRFSGQFEFRAIWEPHCNQKIKPIVLGNYRLGAFCRERALTSRESECDTSLFLSTMP